MERGDRGDLDHLRLRKKTLTQAKARQMGETNCLVMMHENAFLDPIRG